MASNNDAIFVQVLYFYIFGIYNLCTWMITVLYNYIFNTLLAMYHCFYYYCIIECFVYYMVMSSLSH